MGTFPISPGGAAQPHARQRYLLDAAAGPLHPAARGTLYEAFDQGWADYRSLHSEGRLARRLLDQAREVLATGLAVRAEEVSFLPSGSAAIATGLEGLRYAGRRRGAHVAATAVEHSVVLRDLQHRAAAEGEPAEWVPVDREGRLDPSAWKHSVHRPGTVGAVIQSANGEVGTRQPLHQAYEDCRAAGVPLLVDATAGLGRDAVPEAYDVLAGDARSWAGPPGVGVLVVPARTRWRLPGPPAEAEGGRSSVDPVLPLVLAAAEAWRQTEHQRSADAQLAHELIAQVRAAATALPDTEVVGDPHDRMPHVVTFSCLFADGEALVDELDRRGFAVASGSACTSSTLEPSHVLAAMGVLTHGNVRVTLPLAAVDPDRAEAVARFCAVLPAALAAVRERLST